MTEHEELAALIDQIALAWEPNVCLLGNMTASQLARAATLLRQPAPAPADLTPVAYDAKAGTRIELTRSTPCPLWAVRSGAYRMSIHGEWSVEPMPSSRTADYLAMHSFPSPAAALAELQRYRKAVASFDGPQPPQNEEVVQ